MPLYLTDEQKRRIANRVMLQKPAGMSERELAAWRRGIEGVFNGIPGDVLFTLDSLRLLAEQGNRVAADLFDYESERLGFTRARQFGPL